MLVIATDTSPVSVRASSSLTRRRAVSERLRALT
jgi:hypothetical protein